MHSIPIRFRLLKATGAAAVLAVLAVATPAFAISVTVNGAPVTLNPPPVERAGRVLVPLRGVFEQLGATVVYESGVINATAGDRSVSLTIGSQQATVDGAPQTLDVAPFIIGASTYVPLRFVSQALGATVNYDGTNQIVALTTAQPPPPQAAPAAPPSYAQQVVDVGPPPLPQYEQPPCPAPNLIWTPGYWAWGPYGYYWVPGTWVAAPQPGLLWTPGYWGYAGGGYGWHPGYWGIHVGFYGGVNYGAGYFGQGYAGGDWRGNDFRYNTAVTNVNTTIVKNVYVNKTVIVNNYNTTNVSYNGGPAGVRATPSPAELAVDKGRKIPPTPLQRQHAAFAAKDRNLLATVNHGKPPTPAVVKPFTPESPPEHLTPIQAEDRAAAEGHVKTEPIAPKPGVKPSSEAKPAPETEVKPAPENEAKPTPETEAKPTPEGEIKTVPEKVVKPTPEGEIKTVPEKVVKPTPEGEVKPAPEKVVKPTPEGEVKPVPEKVVKPTPEREAKPLPKSTVKPAVHKTPAPVHKPAPEAKPVHTPAAEKSHTAAPAEKEPTAKPKPEDQ